VSLELMKEKGIPLDKQKFDWRDIVRMPTSKLDDDALTRVRIILMNGIEAEALRFQHACARMNKELQLALARVRRIEQHQQTMINWMLPADLSPLETTIGFEQVAIEVTASVAQHEPDPYLAQVYRFGLLEDFDHMYRFAALMDRVSGGDANNILQSYSDILPGRPTSVEHRAPEDDLRECYDRNKAQPISKLNAVTIMGGEHQTHDYYMTIGPMFADPVARQLYAEIASIEEQHVTQYESIIDPEETWLEKWLMHEAAEIYNYYSCLQYETNSRVKSVWERFVDYELGHLHHVLAIFRKFDKRDPGEIISESLPEPIEYKSHREYVRKVLAAEVNLRARGKQIIRKEEETPDSPSVLYRQQMNSNGSPSEIVAAGYKWKPGTELAQETPDIKKLQKKVA
jgi:rubrerythrin